MVVFNQRLHMAAGIYMGFGKPEIKRRSKLLNSIICITIFEENIEFIVKYKQYPSNNLDKHNGYSCVDQLK